jgi:hypothetical protein
MIRSGKSQPWFFSSVEARGGEDMLVRMTF